MHGTNCLKALILVRLQALLVVLNTLIPSFLRTMNSQLEAVSDRQLTMRWWQIHFSIVLKCQMNCRGRQRWTATCYDSTFICCNLWSAACRLLQRSGDWGCKMERVVTARSFSSVFCLARNNKSTIHGWEHVDDHDFNNGSRNAARTNYGAVVSLWCHYFSDWNYVTSPTTQCCTSPGE